MRTALLALASACLLVACGPSGGASGDSAAPAAESTAGGAFPTLNAVPYRIEANLHDDQNRTVPLVMIRDGGRMRVEVTADGNRSTIITNVEAGESFIIANAGGQQIALRASGMGEQFSDPAEAWGADVAAQATRTGSCSVAGEAGSEWTSTRDGADTVCVTEDGIILRSTDNGRIVWETTRVDRGPQAASLFELPPGVEVMNLGNVGDAMNQVMQRARGGD